MSQTLPSLRWFLACAMLLGLAGLSVGQPAAGEKRAILKVLVPDAPTTTELEVSGLKTKQTGSVRTFHTPPLPTGKKYSYVVKATIEPNNYTKIIRTRKVVFEAGQSVTLDMRKEDKVNDKVVVRWVPTPDDIVDRMCKLGKVGKKDIVYDLGCGDAVMLIRPIKIFHAKKGVGIDIDPKMVKRAKDNVKEAGLEDKIEIRQGDILDVKDISDATVVLLYLGLDMNLRLKPMLQKSLKPGARVVSHRFLMGDWKPDESITVTGMEGNDYKLNLWVIPKK